MRSPTNKSLVDGGINFAAYCGALEAAEAYWIAAADSQRLCRRIPLLPTIGKSRPCTKVEASNADQLESGPLVVRPVRGEPIPSWAMCHALTNTPIRRWCQLQPNLVQILDDLLREYYQAACGEGELD